MPIVFSALGTVTKGLVQGVEDLEVRSRVETIQTTVYQDRPEYWKVSKRLEETCYNSNSIKKPSANAGVKNSQKSKMLIMKSKSRLCGDKDESDVKRSIKRSMKRSIKLGMTKREKGSSGNCVRDLNLFQLTNAQNKIYPRKKDIYIYMFVQVWVSNKS